MLMLLRLARPRSQSRCPLRAGPRGCGSTAAADGVSARAEHQGKEGSDPKKRDAPCQRRDRSVHSRRRGARRRSTPSGTTAQTPVSAITPARERGEKESDTHMHLGQQLLLRAHVPRGGGVVDARPWRGDDKLRDLRLRVGDDPAREARVRRAVHAAVEDVLAPPVEVVAVNIVHTALVDEDAVRTRWVRY